MNFARVKRLVARNISNVVGWRTTKQLVIFESDDWGSIRMPSRKVSEQLQTAGVDVGYRDSARYNQNDTLAQADDLSALFEQLRKHRDGRGRPPVFTAISLMANPNFEKIKKSNYLEYHYEPFTDTLKRYYGNANVFQLWKQGFEEGLFIPQFHGREHLHVPLWLQALQEGDRETQLAFDHGVWAIRSPFNERYHVSYQAAFDLVTPNDLHFQREAIHSGLALFESLFGYKARFFVPPNGPFNNSLEQVAHSSGIQFMSASKIQAEPLGYGKIKKRFHYLGQKNDRGQIYLTRNCFFEPSQSGHDSVASCMKDIDTAFRWRKPAVISTHRVNYIGGLNEANRQKGLESLNELLKSILRKWPNVEFITSVELGDLINGGNRFNTKLI